MPANERGRDSPIRDVRLEGTMSANEQGDGPIRDSCRGGIMPANERGGDGPIRDGRREGTMATNPPSETLAEVVARLFGKEPTENFPQHIWLKN